MNFKYPQGATPLDLEELMHLIPNHIATQEELNAWEEKNILSARKWAIRQKEILSDDFIKNLHYHMFNETWSWAGQYRKSEKNIGIEWIKIPVAIRELCKDVQYQLDNKAYSNDEIAIRFHHKLVFIHPFPNGNGRHARFISDLLIVQQGGKSFSWGMNRDLYKESPVRKLYIEALHLADKGNFSQLLLFARN